MQDVQTPAVPKVVGKSKSSAASDRGGKRARAPVKLPPVAPYVPYVSAFAIGDQISHLQFGEGTVTEIDGGKLTIDFANRGTKQIVDDVRRSKER